jgi:hypothetical protein
LASRIRASNSKDFGGICASGHQVIAGKAAAITETQKFEKPMKELGMFW